MVWKYRSHRVAHQADLKPGTIMSYAWNDPIILIDQYGLAPRLPKATAGEWECTSGADGLEHCEPADPDEEIGSTTQKGAPMVGNV